MVEVGSVWLASGETVAREGPGVSEHRGLLLDEAPPTDSTCGVEHNMTEFQIFLDETLTFSTQASGTFSMGAHFLWPLLDFKLPFEHCYSLSMVH